MSKGKHADARATISINDLLKQHVRLVGDGVVEYADGWDDERIAAAAGPDIAKSSVARIRQQMYGRLFNRAGGEQQRVNELEDHLRELIHQHADLHDRFATLCETLTLNRVVQVRHLGRKINGATGSAAPPQAAHA